MFDIITHARAPAGTLIMDEITPAGSQRCACCDLQPARTRVAGTPLCLTCAPAYALDQNGLGALTCLIWQPRFDQGVLSRMVHAIHAATLLAASVPDTAIQEQAQRGQDILAELNRTRAQARACLGTDSPAELREIVSSMAFGEFIGRTSVSGVRVLLLKPDWFAPDVDLYRRDLQDALAQP